MTERTRVSCLHANTNGDPNRCPCSPAGQMLLTTLGDVRPRHMADLLSIASLIGDVDGGRIAAQTVVG